MKLREYQAKRVFREYGIRVPEGGIARSAEEAERIAERLAGPVVLKPQLGVKGRGKAGGIRFAADPAAAREEAGDLLFSRVRGEAVETLLVEERVAIEDELYAAVTVDYDARCPVLVASGEGGVEIETVARDHPERVLRVPVNILTGPGIETLQTLSARLGKEVAKHLGILYRVFRETDAELVEVNPLVLTSAGAYMAVDAVLNVNEDSVGRHADLSRFAAEIPAGDPIAREASESNWTWIELDGDIGVLSSGAGLTMTILDLLHRAGGRPANFLDTAQFDEEGIVRAFDLLARAGQYRALLVNIFAGLNRCDSLARGIRRAFAEREWGTPVVVRMVGNREEEGHRILREAGIEPLASLEEAVESAVRLAGGREREG